MTNPLKDNDKKEIDLASLIFSLWRFKGFILLSIILSLPVSLYVIKKSIPIFESASVIQIAGEANSQLPDASMRLANSFIAGNVISRTGKNDLIPKIMGAEFLKTHILPIERVKNYLDKNCQYSKPRIFTITGLLDYLGVYKVKKPTNTQLQFLKVKCLQKMISIDRYKYKKLTTSAFTIKGTSKDPEFSAALVNDIVDSFFENERDTKNDKYRKTIKYLSDLTANAEFNLDNAKERLEDHLLEHGAVMYQENIAGSVGLSAAVAPLQIAFQKTLNLKSAQLSKAEKFEADLYKTLRKLDGFVGKDVVNVLIDIREMPNYGGLSSGLISEALRLSKSDLSSREKSERIREKIDAESGRINTLVDRNKKQIVKQEEEIESLVEIGNDLSSLQADVLRKSSYFSALQDQMINKSYETGTKMLNEDYKYSTAYPPVYALSPKKKEIFLFFAILFFLVSMSIIICRQLVRQTVFSVGQLKGINGLGAILSVSLKRRFPFDWMDPLIRLDRISIDISLMERIKIVGKVGCVVDLGTKKVKSNNYLNDITSSLADLFARDGNKTLAMKILKTGLSLRIFSIGKSSKSEQEVIGPGASGPNVTIMEAENLSEFTEKIFPLTENLSEYDKIIFPLAGDVDDIEKFKMIKKVDFYVLIGRSGNFNMNTVGRFAQQIEGQQNKCLGTFILQ